MPIYYLKILALTILMAMPFYYFNKFLQRKINPRANGKMLLLYFALVITAAFAYVTVVVFVVIQIAKIFK